MSAVSIWGAETVMTEAASAYHAALGSRLLAAYALGSLAHGGFSPLVSDIDLGLIVRDPLRSSDPETIQSVAVTEKSKGSELHERLSVFWGTPSTLRGEREGGRFPALDRLDLLENGRLLIGTEARTGLSRPSSDELITQGAEFALGYLTGSAVEEIRNPMLLLGQGVRRLTKLVLFPVRFLFTAETGEVGTNDGAVTHYLACGSAPSATLVAAAFAWRTAPPNDHQAAAELLREAMVPLYLHYIADHITRFETLGRVDLALAFDDWRDRIVR